MPKTLLAVDDSATMRKVLEITFAGEDFRVVTADGASTALSRLAEDPAVALVDATLGGDDGYALAREVRARDARIAVVMMASRYAPYDANRGKEAGVDDFVDKPFDTQALIDKVKKAIVARETRAAAPPPAPTVAAPQAAPVAPAPRPPAPPAPAMQPKAAWPSQRTHTLSFEGSPQGPAPIAPATRTAATGGVVPPTVPAQASPPAAPPTRAPVPAAPQAAPSAHTVPTATPPREVPPAPPQPPASMAAAMNGHLASKLGDLGLTPQQAEAVLALSREVVERVVWEVVPQLAETIIKEEIARLTTER